MKKNDNGVCFDSSTFPIIVMPHRESSQSKNDQRSRALHEAIEIKYFYEGTSTLLVGNKTVRAEAGDVIVINPYEFHSTLECEGKDSGKYHLLIIGLDMFGCFDGSISDIRATVFGKGIKFKTHNPSDTNLGAIIERIILERERKDESYELATLGLLAELFVYLVRNCTENDLSSPDESMRRYYSVIEPALRLIRDEYNKKLTIDTLSRACLTSKYYFCRIFKLCTGVSAMQYLKNHRLKVADSMLTETGARVEDVAEECGFSDTSYFCRIYKKRFGHTPKGKKD